VLPLATGARPRAPRRLEAKAAAAAAARAAAEREENELPRPTPLPRPLSRVEAAAGMYEALDAKAKAAPALVEVTRPIVGQRSRKLLDGFEKRDAEAHAVLDLVEVDASKLKANESFRSMLSKCEEADKKAAAEPKLEKTFVQRERESVQRVLALQDAARMQVQVPSVH
jgi:hypothetical protein